MREQVKISDCIYRSNKATTDNTPEQDSNKYYTCFGEQDFLDSEGYSRVSAKSDRIYAHTNVDEYGAVNYFVKANRYGKLYNPTGMYTEGQHKRFNKMIGANEFQFKKVNLRVFELYISFLKTKNVAWLNNAEREIL